MTVWELQMRYKRSTHTIKAELMYHSTQVMRIKVYGSHTNMLLENNYPSIPYGSKKGVQWKIKEGGLSEISPESTVFLIALFERLEKHIKVEFPKTLPIGS